MLELTENDLEEYEAAISDSDQELWETIVDWVSDWGWYEVRLWCTDDSRYYDDFNNNVLDGLIVITHKELLDELNYGRQVFIYDIKITHKGLIMADYERL